VRFKLHDVVVYKSVNYSIQVGAVGRVIYVFPVTGIDEGIETYNVDFGRYGGIFTIYGHELKLLDPAKDDSMVAAKVEAIEACIRTVKAQIQTAKACRYNDSYMGALRDILVSHEASLERVKRGEGYHPSTPVCGQGEEK
jgi:hypothetical protein